MRRIVLFHAFFGVAAAIVTSIAPASVSADAPTDATDLPPPSQAIPSDRATPRRMYQAMAVVRAPFDRSYGVGFGMSPVRPVAIELRIAMRDDASVELAAGAVLYLLGRAFDGPLLRVSPAALISPSGQAAATGFRLDLETGYAISAGSFLVEVDLGASYRRGGPYASRASWAFALGLRVGVAY